MRFNFVFLVLLLLLVSKFSFGQDKINLMSGKVLDVKITDINETKINFSVEKRSGKIENSIDVYRVFSVEYKKNNKEIIIYKRDTLRERFNTAEQQRMFIYGEQDAMKGKLGTGSFIFGTALGVLGGGFFGYYKSVLVVAVPILGLSANIPRTKIKESLVSNKEYLKQPTYVEGYRRIVKTKRTRNALLGTILGSAVAYTIASLASNR